VEHAHSLLRLRFHVLRSPLPPSSFRAQSSEELRIRRRKRVASQFLPRHPGEGGTANGLRLVLEPKTKEKLQMNRPFSVAMCKALNALTHLNLDGKLFQKLTPQTLLESFSRLALASRELPQPRQMSALRPLRDQQLPVAENEPGADFDKIQRNSAVCQLAH
jgi:hypothetical protein